MSPYIIFDLKKLIRRPRTRLILLAYLMAFLGFFVFLHEGAQTWKKEQAQQFRMLAQSMEQSHEGLERQHELFAKRFEGQEHEERLRVMEAKLQSSQALAAAYRSMAEAYASNEDLQRSQATVAIMEAAIESSASAQVFYSNDPPIYEAYEQQIQLMKTQLDYAQKHTDQGLHLMHPKVLSAWTFLILFFRHFLPYAFPILIALLFADLFSDDMDHGFIKFSATTADGRKRLLQAKALLVMSLSLVLVLVSLSLAFLLAGTVHGFGSTQSLMLYDTASFSSLRPLPNYLAEDLKLFSPAHGQVGPPDALGLSSYSSQGDPALPFPLPAERLLLIPVASFVLRSLPQLISSVLFWSLLILFISYLSQKNVLASGLAFLLSLSVFFFAAPKENLSFFARCNVLLYLDPSLQISGLGSATSLHAILLLCSYSLLLYGLMRIHFRHRDLAV